MAISQFSLALTCACALSACDKVDEFKAFFKAKPVDERTALTVEALPPIGATLPGSIDVDGQRVSNKTPHTIKPLSPGKHRVRIEAQGYVSMEMEALLEEGQDNKMTVTLNPRVSASAPTTSAAKHPTGKKKLKGGKEELTEQDEANVHTAKTMLVTASPVQAVLLDGSVAGTATGLRVELSNDTGELELTGGNHALTFSYANKAGHVRIKPKQLAHRTLTVDGHALKKPWIDIDSRPHRIELSDPAGNKQAWLMRVVE